MECFLLADDLTGACDAAVCFATRGRRTMVPIAPDADLEGADVYAVSSESRDLEPSAVASAILAAAANRPNVAARILFKKIDSTLRGHAGAEIAAALDAFGCDLAVVCPAFPRMNRIVAGGFLHVTSAGGFTPIEVAPYLRAQGVAQCAQTQPDAIRSAVAAGARVVVLDAVCDEDLDSIVAAVMPLGLRTLWAGSAGLAAALARTLPAAPRSSKRRLRTAGPVMFCIGSDHPATVAQRNALENQMQIPLIDAEKTTAKSIGAGLRQGRGVMLRIPRGRVPAKRLAELIAGATVAALMVTGGDTASLLCRAAGVQSIDIVDEILPGIPHGIIRGGVFDGVSVVTKSGGFGAPDALIQIAEYFSCPN